MRASLTEYLVLNLLVQHRFCLRIRSLSPSAIRRSFTFLFFIVSFQNLTQPINNVLSFGQINIFAYFTHLFRRIGNFYSLVAIYNIYSPTYNCSRTQGEVICMDHVLVLNASFEPVVVVHWQKAMQLLFQGKVEVLEEYDREIRTVTMTFRLPSVLRLIRFIPTLRKKNIVRFSRTNILMRDAYTCQYCGRKRQKSELTLDHVVPAVQGGKKTWDNIVTACTHCNQKKGGRTPSEAGMRLIAKPCKPSWLPEYSVQLSLKSTPEKWKLYFSWQISPSIQQQRD